MDYAALVSLTQTLNLMMNNDQHRATMHDDPITVQIIQSLQEKACFLLSFVKDFPPNATMEFERRIRDAASEAEHIIDNIFSLQLRLKYYMEKSCCELQDISRSIQLIIAGLSCCSNFKLLRTDLMWVLQQIEGFFDEINDIKKGPHIQDKELACANTLKQLVRNLGGVSSDIHRRGWNLRVVSWFTCCFIYGSLSAKLQGISREISRFLDKVTMFPLDNGLPLLRQKLQVVAQKIGEIVEEAKEKMAVGFEGTIPRLPASSMARPNINDIMMVGFEDELQAMRERLCGESPKREVVPIVGMGGIGKTTLARYIYNDKLIVETFCFRAFVTISQEYDAKEILKQLLPIKEPTNESAESLIEKLHKHLKGRRYLTILDDMWSREAWNVVRRALPDDKNRSRVVLTTRILEVAHYIDSSAPLLRIKSLNNDQSWSLLQKKIYCEESCPLELVESGTRISEKCRGYFHVREHSITGST